MKFKVGDYIVGKKSADLNYNMTTSGVICHIESIVSEDVIYITTIPIKAGFAFRVNPSHFRLAKKREIDNMLADMV